jgi:hypothetical protein
MPILNTVSWRYSSLSFASSQWPYSREDRTYIQLKGLSGKVEFAAGPASRASPVNKSGSRNLGLQAEALSINYSLFFTVSELKTLKSSAVAH